MTESELAPRRESVESLAEHRPQVAHRVAEARPSSSSDALSVEARRRGIAVTLLGARKILLLSGFGRTARLFGTITDRTSHLAVMLADDKRATKQLLSKHGLPTPPSYAVDIEDEAVNALTALDGIVVVKPHNGAQGRGVSVGLSTQAEVRNAFRLAARFSRVVLVERYRSGRDYRVLVVNGRLVAAAERRPPLVVGDGDRSVAQLIAEENNSALRGAGEERPLTKIAVDERVEDALRRSGTSLSTVPLRGQIVVLNPIGSLSLGSRSIDRTDEIHSELAALVIEAAELIGLDIAGVDLIAKDISLPLRDADAEIIEINCSPGLRAHLYPAEGKPRNPAVAIIDYLFPESRSES